MSFLALKVPVIESEVGWGSRIDDYMICLSVEDAEKFVLEFNSKNTEDKTPDWYMYATSDFVSVDLNDEQLSELNETKKKRIWWSAIKNVK